jgi:hypothetical protein
MSNNFATCGIIRCIDAASHFCVNISINSGGKMLDLIQHNSNKIQRTWCSDNGTLVGGNGKQAIVCSHYNCFSENCYCENIAQDFLNHKGDILSFKENLTKTYIYNNSSMFFVFVNGADIFTLNISFFGEMEWISYESGSTYFLNENKLSNSTHGYILDEKNVLDGTNKWLCGTCPCDVAPILTSNLSLLFSDVNYSSGISLFQTGGQASIIPITNIFEHKPIIDISKKNKRKMPKAKDSVKGYISGYNRFVQHCHDNNDFPNVSNNNSKSILVAQKWKSLSKLEKEPFENSSLLDKQRYLKEIEIANINSNTKLFPKLKKIKEEINDDDNKEDNVVKKKPRTAYSIFVNQEKQFIELFDSDLNKKVGLLSGLRWNNISESEKKLYDFLSNEEAQSLKQLI